MDKQLCKTCVDLEGALTKLAESEALEYILAKEFGRPVAQAMRTMMRTGKLSGEVGDDLHDFFIDAIVNDSREKRLACWPSKWPGRLSSSFKSIRLLAG